MPERPDSDREVLTSLPRSRPVRRSAKRADRPAADGAVRPSATPVAARKPRTAAATSAAKPAAAQPAAPAAAPPIPPHASAPRKIPAAGYAAPDTHAGDTAGSPAAELIATTLQAATELAQIGITVGRQTLKSMLDRLPKP